MFRLGSKTFITLRPRHKALLTNYCTPRVRYSGIRLPVLVSRRYLTTDKDKKETPNSLIFSGDEAKLRLDEIRSIIEKKLGGKIVESLSNNVDVIFFEYEVPSGKDSNIVSEVTVSFKEDSLLGDDTQVYSKDEEVVKKLREQLKN